MQELWADLLDFSLQLQEPWVVGGDFNVISQSSEKLGGAPWDHNSMHDFHNFFT